MSAMPRGRRGQASVQAGWLGQNALTLHEDPDNAGEYMVVLNSPDDPDAFIRDEGGGEFAIYDEPDSPVTHYLTMTPDGVAVAEV